LEFRDIIRVSEAITAKRMKIDPYCQRLNCTRGDQKVLGLT